MKVPAAAAWLLPVCRVRGACVRNVVRHSRPATGNRRSSTPRAQRGYSLLEVIVAFALLAMALTLLLGTMSGASRQVRYSADAGRAALHARSLLDQVGAGVMLAPGRRDGELEDGRYRWTLDVARWRDPAQPADAPVDPSGATLLEITLQMQWGEGGPRERLGLRTLRLVPASLEATQ